METFTAFLKQIGQIFTWWVMVAPWEQALRVRLGKHVRVLAPGIHLRIPFFDTVFLQCTRMRVAHLSLQTVLTRDRRALTVGATLGFVLTDIEKLYRTLHHAQDTLMNLTAMAIADAAVAVDSAELTPDALAKQAASAIDFAGYGLSEVAVRITDFAFVLTYRLITDQRWGTYGDTLNVNSPQS